MVLTHTNASLLPCSRLELNDSSPAALLAALSWGDERKVVASLYYLRDKRAGLFKEETSALKPKMSLSITLSWKQKRIFYLLCAAASALPPSCKITSVESRDAASIHPANETVTDGKPFDRLFTSTNFSFHSTSKFCYYLFIILFYIFNIIIKIINK